MRTNIVKRIIREALEKKGSQLGSNPGGVYQDSDNFDKFYLKFPRTSGAEDQTKTELLASKLQNLMGIRNFDPKPFTHEGRDGIISDFREGETGLSHNNVHNLTPDQQNDIGRIFAHAVLTRNWDAVGTGLNYGSGNIRIHNGKVHGIDPGGSFHFRAQGGIKFNGYPEDVSEFHSLRDPNINPESSNIFNTTFKSNPGAMRAGVEAARNLDMGAVEHAFRNSGLSNWEKLHETFKKRRNNFLDIAGDE
jgi:hypothetical protein